MSECIVPHYGRPASDGDYGALHGADWTTWRQERAERGEEDG